MNYILTPLKQDFFSVQRSFFYIASADFINWNYGMSIDKKICALWHFRNLKIPFIENVQQKWRQVADFWQIHFALEPAMIHLLLCKAFCQPHLFCCDEKHHFYGEREKNEIIRENLEIQLRCRMPNKNLFKFADNRNDLE